MTCCCSAGGGPIATVGSIIAVTPAIGGAVVTAGSRTRNVPLIGWAVVVTECDGASYGTTVEPLLLVGDRRPMTASQLVELAEDECTIKINTR